MFDAQVLTDGSLIVLEAGGVIYRYRQCRRPAHTWPFLCETPGSIRVSGIDSRAEPPGMSLWSGPTTPRRSTARGQRDMPLEQAAAVEEQFVGAPGPRRTMPARTSQRTPGIWGGRRPTQHSPTWNIGLGALVEVGRPGRGAREIVGGPAQESSPSSDELAESLGGDGGIRLDLSRAWR